MREGEGEGASERGSEGRRQEKVSRCVHTITLNQL